MGFEIYPRQSVHGHEIAKILVCEREVKKSILPIVDDTEIRDDSSRTGQCSTGNPR